MSLMPLCHCGSVLGSNRACETCNDYANSYKHSTCPDCGHDDCQCAAVSACLPPGSRRAEVESEIVSADGAYCEGAWIGPESLRYLARALADEVDELRSEAAAKDAVIGKLLALLKPRDNDVLHMPRAHFYARACEIAGRTE